MSVEFTESLKREEWAVLAAVYQRTPLGARDPEGLKVVFDNSRHRRFAYRASVFPWRKQSTVWSSTSPAACMKA